MRDFVKSAAKIDLEFSAISVEIKSEVDTYEEYKVKLGEIMLSLNNTY